MPMKATTAAKAVAHTDIGCLRMPPPFVLDEGRLVFDEGLACMETPL
ncbi:hypothetical protein GCM10009527_000830 [Actinomadura nitritigenes]